jgi:hypothetical protein
MRISKMLKRMTRLGRSQQGFSIPEAMIAGVILTLVSMPMMNMFSASIQMSRYTNSYNQVQACVRSYAEQVRAIPFYVPYVSSDGNQDMDDWFWGTRASVTSNSWDSAPEVLYKDYNTTKYPQFKVYVRMVYLPDDLNGLSEPSVNNPMKSNWGPKSSGYDKPIGKSNNVFHMVKYEVKAYWESSSGTESYSTTAIRTDTEAEMGILVSSCTNITADATSHGSKHAGTPGSLEDEADNTAPHTRSGIRLSIKGVGLSSVTSIKLAKDKNADIPVAYSSSDVNADGTEIQCTVDLSAGGTTTFPWTPKRTPGGWTVMVFVDKAFAVLLDGLIVEFPIPKLTAVTPTSALDSATTCSIKVTGSSIISLDITCKPLLRLVKKGADGAPDTSKIIDSAPSVATVTTTGNPTSYNANPNDITATFNLSGKELGEYYLWVVNCKNYTVISDMGNVTGSSQNAVAGAFVFTITKAPPTVSNVKETAPPNRTYGFNNRSYNLTITGTGFDTDTGTGHTVTVYMGGPTDVNPSASATATAVVANSTTITADLNLSGFTGANVGNCWVRVQNDYYTQSGSLSNAYVVRKPPNTISQTSTGTCYNYYDIPVQVDGTDFYAGYQVYYQNSTGGTVYRIGETAGTNPDGTGANPDGEGVPVFTNPTSTTARATGYLNLIGVPAGTSGGINYKIWVADPYEAGNYLVNGTTTGTVTFANTYGTPVLLDATAPASGVTRTRDTASVVLASRRYWKSGTWIYTNYLSFENNGASAFSRYATSTENVWVKFRLRGMGFLDAGIAGGGGTTKVEIGNNSSYGSFSAALVDRASRKVELITSNLANPVTDWVYTSTNFIWQLKAEAAASYNLILTNDAAHGGGTKTYTGRWKTSSTSTPPAWTN